MADRSDRRNSERLLVDPESLEHILPDNLRPMSREKTGERLIVPAESLDRISMDEPQRDTEDRTEPIRLSFLALLAERDPVVQARLNLRRAHAAETGVLDEDRPTDPMPLVAKVSGR